MQRERSIDLPLSLRRCGAPNVHYFVLRTVAESSALSVLAPYPGLAARVGLPNSNRRGSNVDVTVLPLSHEPVCKDFPVCAGPHELIGLANLHERVELSEWRRSRLASAGQARHSLLLAQRGARARCMQAAGCERTNTTEPVNCRRRCPTEARARVNPDGSGQRRMHRAWNPR